MTADPNVEALRQTMTTTLRQAGVDEPAAKVDWWLAETLGCSPADLDRRAHGSLPAAVADAWPRALEQLAAGEPLAYVLGHAPFHDLSLTVDARVLIPRPETEELVARVLADSRWWAAAPRRVVDVGTGSGAIALALAAARPEAEVWGIDPSADALAVAGINARQLGMDRVRFQQGDLLATWSGGPIDLVVANLPYIPTEEWRTLAPEVRDREPRLALDGGPDGLTLIHRLLPQARRWRAPSGRLALEFAETQGDSVRLAAVDAGWSDAIVEADYLGKPRFLFA